MRQVLTLTLVGLIPELLKNVVLSLETCWVSWKFTRAPIDQHHAVATFRVENGMHSHGDQGNTGGRLTIQEVSVQSILTRTSGFLDGVASHSLQPYQGCTFGNSLCGVGCYVQHNHYLLQQRAWGSFLDVRANAAEVYRKQYRAEKNWAQRAALPFVIFCSSSTDPFLPHERNYRISRALLLAMLDLPPDGLILQTHSHQVLDEMDTLVELAKKCTLRVHLSIETDLTRLPGLPPHATPIEKRFEAAARLRSVGLFTVITVAPLLPIQNPEAFFQRIGDCADAAVLDHFIEGDGSNAGSRTARTALPSAIAAIHPGAELLSYRDAMVDLARQILPGRVGVGKQGFAGNYL